MATRPATTVRFDETERAFIEEFKEQSETESQTEAIQRMVRIAHRETKHPLSSRLKDEVVEWAGHLGIAAIIVFVGGATTPVLPIGEAALFAISLMIVALLLVAGYELIRLALGQNELGVHVRDVMRGDRA